MPRSYEALSKRWQTRLPALLELLDTYRGAVQSGSHETKPIDGHRAAAMAGRVARAALKKAGKGKAQPEAPLAKGLLARAAGIYRQGAVKAGLKAGRGAFKQEMNAAQPGLDRAFNANYGRRFERLQGGPRPTQAPRIEVEGTGTDAMNNSRGRLRAKTVARKQAAWDSTARASSAAARNHAEAVDRGSRAGVSWTAGRRAKAAASKAIVGYHGRNAAMAGGGAAAAAGGAAYASRDRVEKLAKGWTAEKHPREHDGQFAAKTAEKAGRFAGGAAGAIGGFALGHKHGAGVGETVGRKVGDMVGRVRGGIHADLGEMRGGSIGRHVGGRFGGVAAGAAIGVAGHLAGAAIGRQVDEHGRRKRAAAAGRTEIYDRLNSGVSALPAKRKDVKVALQDAKGHARKVKRAYDWAGEVLGKDAGGPSSMQFEIPLIKIDEERRLIYARAAEEVPDKSREIMDYATARPQFEKWSGHFEQISGGLSKGNVRAMHNPRTSAGKVTEIMYDDAARAVDVCLKVVDDQEWKKCLEGVYTGLSIGGGYLRKWKDPSSGLTRYTPIISEISLVDNPCMPTAKFAELVKADGSAGQLQLRGRMRSFEEALAAQIGPLTFEEALAKRELSEAEHAQRVAAGKASGEKRRTTGADVVAAASGGAIAGRSAYQQISEGLPATEGMARRKVASMLRGGMRHKLRDQVKRAAQERVGSPDGQAEGYASAAHRKVMEEAANRGGDMEEAKREAEAMAEKVRRRKQGAAGRGAYAKKLAAMRGRIRKEEVFRGVQVVRAQGIRPTFPQALGGAVAVGAAVTAAGTPMQTVFRHAFEGDEISAHDRKVAMASGAGSGLLSGAGTAGLMALRARGLSPKVRAAVGLGIPVASAALGAAAGHFGIAGAAEAGKEERKLEAEEKAQWAKHMEGVRARHARGELNRFERFVYRKDI